MCARGLTHPQQQNARPGLRPGCREGKESASGEVKRPLRYVAFSFALSVSAKCDWLARGAREAWPTRPGMPCHWSRDVANSNGAAILDSRFFYARLTRRFVDTWLRVAYYASDASRAPPAARGNPQRDDAILGCSAPSSDFVQSGKNFKCHFPPSRNNLPK
jgi:hypothetical protein